MHLRIGTLALLAALAGCGDAETPETPETPEAAPETPETPELDKDKLEADAAVKETLVPSPLETQKALEAAGNPVTWTEWSGLLPDDEQEALAAAARQQAAACSDRPIHGVHLWE